MITTAHAVYREREFEPGDTVIDPWRMIADQPGVTVRRLGANRPELISVLIPSRGRPDWFNRMYTTLNNTATHPRQIEVVAWIDEDDPTKLDYPVSKHGHVQIRYLTGPRSLLSDNWNSCAYHANGNIFMHCGDDITFDTPGWDQMVRQEFARSDDKILFVYGNDLGPHGETFGTHGFLHRRWTETVGYFVPPLFSSDWNDVWLNDVAKMISRHRLLPFITEHHHYTFGKAERDQTHHEREERGARDDVVTLYKRTEKKRKQDAEKLKAVMV